MCLIFSRKKVRRAVFWFITSGPFGPMRIPGPIAGLPATRARQRARPRQKPPRCWRCLMTSAPYSPTMAWKKNIGVWNFEFRIRSYRIFLTAKLQGGAFAVQGAGLPRARKERTPTVACGFSAGMTFPFFREDMPRCFAKGTRQPDETGGGSLFQSPCLVRIAKKSTFPETQKQR